MKKLKLNPNRNIYPVDERGYCLMKIMINKSLIQKTYSYSANGGKRKSIAKAKKQRDQIERITPNLPRSRKGQGVSYDSRYRKKANINNGSCNKAGVSLCSLNKRGKIVLTWVAAIVINVLNEPKINKIKQFSVSAHGYQAAKRKAIQARKEMEKLAKQRRFNELRNFNK